MKFSSRCSFLAWGVAGTLLACNPAGPGEPLLAPGPGFQNPNPNPTNPSQTTDGPQVVISSNGSALYVASPEDNVVSRLNVATDQVEEFDLPGEPTRIARVGDRLVVTLRAQREVAVLSDSGGRLAVVNRVPVGAEPYGIVASPDGTAVYVASSMSQQVEKIDTRTWSVVQSWNVPNQPSWLAMHPSGRSLYITTAREGRLHRLDISSGQLQEVNLPSAMGFDFVAGPMALTPRMTGDPAVSPDGTRLAMPMLFANNITEIPDEADPGPGPEPGGYDNRMNPVAAIVKLDNNGQVDATEPDFLMARSFEVAGYLASVTFSPDSSVLAAPIEGANGLVVMHFNDDFYQPSFEVEPGLFEIGFRTFGLIETNEGPQSVAFTSNREARVYSFLDRTLDRADLAELLTAITENPERNPLFGEAGFFDSVADSVVVSSNRFDASVERGRRLFFATDDSRMASIGGAVSCGTCHFSLARDDGLTWNFTRGPRQTPSLAGQVSLREPVRWDGLAATVADDAMGTSQGLMGGQGLTAQDAIDIAAYIDHTRDVDIPLRDSGNPNIAIGRALFNRQDVGCAGCHSGTLLTDLAFHNVNGFDGVKTPSLLNLASSAPYLHDGSAPTIRDLLVRLRDGSKGSTANLTDRDLDALETYLMSL